MTSYGRINLVASAMLAALFCSFVLPAAAKANFDRITVQEQGSETQVEVTDPALLGFFAFTDFSDGRREPPRVVGPAFVVTRWEMDRAADAGFQPWDRLRYYHTSQDNTLGRGWVFYEGLLNGSSEYDGQWYPSTRNADALMEGIIFPSEARESEADANRPSLLLGVVGIAAALVIAALATRLSRQVTNLNSEEHAR